MKKANIVKFVNTMDCNKYINIKVIIKEACINTFFIFYFSSPYYCIMTRTVSNFLKSTAASITA